MTTAPAATPAAPAARPTLKPAHQILLDRGTDITLGRIGRWGDDEKTEKLRALALQLEARATEVVPTEHLDEVIRTTLKAYYMLGEVVSEAACAFVINHLEDGQEGLVRMLTEVAEGEHWVLVQDDNADGPYAMTDEFYQQVLEDQKSGGVRYQHAEFTSLSGRDWARQRTIRVQGTLGIITPIEQINPPLPAPIENTPALGAGTPQLEAGTEDEQVAPPPDPQGEQTTPPPPAEPASQTEQLEQVEGQQ